MKWLFLFLFIFLSFTVKAQDDRPTWDDFWEQWICPSDIMFNFNDSVPVGYEVVVNVKMVDWGKDPRIEPVWLYKAKDEDIIVENTWSFKAPKPGIVLFYCYSQLYHCITEPVGYKVYKP